MTNRRARKGFNLKFNPDEHWSCAFYKGLNKLQYTDGRNIVNINRDDAAGFRLDTLTTCKQYSTPTVENQPILTTRTDFVNKHPSVLQTTSYNFTHTSTTDEICVGVVKAARLHQKNPTQHMADLCMLESKPELSLAFINPLSGAHKQIECIRVDGATDEGPNHEEVQFLWTQHHIAKEKIVTLVTTRSSGSSFLNRVELQNGCLSLGHANTFIPSTIGGSCMDETTGEIDPEKLKRNLNLAIDAYINRVNGCPCGATTIQLYKGECSSEYTVDRKTLIIFLKGSKKEKLALQKTYPDIYKEFQTIWNIHNSHMIGHLPSQYIFMLTCCYKPGCTHPVCKKGEPTEPVNWYVGGPPIATLPFPAKDDERPGHYKTSYINVNNSECVKSIMQPPSTIIKQEFSKLINYPPSDTFIQRLSKKVMLTSDSVMFWLDHLHTVLLNRKRGAAKAAVTRRAKKLNSVAVTLPSDPSSPVSLPSDQTDNENMVNVDTCCGQCEKKYDDVTEEELWIMCDMCDSWYCGDCEGVLEPPSTDLYICLKCRDSK